jgi:hypothetical protein
MEFEEDNDKAAADQHKTWRASLKRKLRSKPLRQITCGGTLPDI